MENVIARNHSPYFLRISKRNHVRTIWFFNQNFRFSQVNDKHPSCFLYFSKKDISLRTDNGHLRSAFCSKKIPQNRNVGAVHDSKFQIAWYFVPFLQFAGCARGGSDLGEECRVGTPPALHPTPKMTCAFFNTTSILQGKKTLCFICVEVNHETRLKNSR